MNNRQLEITLTHIAKALNASGILWSVGASVLLHQYALIASPSDIDITVSEKDVEATDKILSGMGEKQPENESELYATEYFHEYVIDGIAVDVMSGFKINLKNGVFSYIYDEQSVADKFVIGCAEIPFSSLEDWYFLYQMMPDKEKKIALIEDYFKEKGIQHPILFNRMLNNPSLPATVKKRAEKLLQRHL